MKKLILFILFFSSYHLYGQTYRMVKDIKSGGNGADIKNPIVLNGYLYFRADNGTDGGELWKSNGTETGTQMVKDINLGAGTGMMSNYSQIVTLNNNLYFAADDGTNGIELWKSDGSEANTTMLANISAAGSAYPSNLTVVGNILYFSAIHDTYGAELWKYDPATNTTSMVKDINVGGDASPSRLINVNGTLFFAASANGFSDIELWKSDGTPQGTEMVKDINPGTSAGSMGAKFDSAVIGSTLYFIANDGSSGYELWKSDGTPQGTKMVKDIYAGPNGSEPSSLANINGTLYLGANDGINGYELWKSDGSSTGTEMVKDINPGAANANPYAFVALNGQAYFIATTADNGKELWKSNGTTTGTGLVKDFTGNAADGFGNDLLSIGGNLYFVALSNFRFRVWQYDGVPENGGPTVITDGFTDFFVSLANINVLDSKLYFLANTSDNGEELWTIDTYTLPTLNCD
jgi:ELWxxDGT repeat protein